MPFNTDGKQHVDQPMQAKFIHIKLIHHKIFLISKKLTENGTEKQVKAAESASNLRHVAVFRFTLRNIVIIRVGQGFRSCAISGHLH